MRVSNGPLENGSKQTLRDPIDIDELERLKDWLKTKIKERELALHALYDHLSYVEDELVESVSDDL